MRNSIPDVHFKENEIVNRLEGFGYEQLESKINFLFSAEKKTDVGFGDKLVKKKCWKINNKFFRNSNQTLGFEFDLAFPINRSVQKFSARTVQASTMRVN